MKPVDPIKRLLRWKRDPVAFVVECLGGTPYPWQAEALQALADPKLGKVSVKSAHGVGKSTDMAWAALWFISTHFPARVPCTAPTGHQLEDVLWAEIGSWFKKMPEALRTQFEFGAEKLFMKSHPEEAFVVARTAKKEQPEALQGFHSENLLFLIDEASGIPDTIFEVAEGALSTPNAKIFMAANPTRTQGYFFDSHTRTRDLWWRRTVSYFELKGTKAFSPNFVESIKRRYGEDSNVYRVRVLGEFPTGEDDAVIPYTLVTEAVGRDIRPSAKDPIVWGVDVARFGDDRTALAKRKGPSLMEPIQAWTGLDNMQVAGVITQLYAELPKDKKPDDIMVDVIGLGAGVVDRLRENGLPVKGINVAEASAINTKFFRLRDQLWWQAREWFEARACTIPDDADLITELATPRYEILGSGKLKVEAKEDIKKRTLDRASPDKADAFILTFASQKSKGARGPLPYAEDGAI